ncbi:unnamed protein product [Amoebophrya sp. A120]|nr:unnamed protein product [Amoebophrya sp. A120]|eukprot:GSA120T00011733001.1
MRRISARVVPVSCDSRKDPHVYAYFAQISHPFPLVSSREVGRIIGTKGCNIRALEQGSQCRIKTPGKRPAPQFGGVQNNERDDDEDENCMIRITGGNEKLRKRCKEAIDAVLMGSDPGDVFAELDGAGLIRNLDPVVLNYLGKEKQRLETDHKVRLELEAKSLRIWDQDVYGNYAGGSSSSSSRGGGKNGQKGRGKKAGGKNHHKGGPAMDVDEESTTTTATFNQNNVGSSSTGVAKSDRIEQARQAIQQEIDDLQTSEEIIVRVPGNRVNQIINHSSLRQLQDTSHIQTMVTKDDEGTGIRLIGLKGAIEEGRNCIEKLIQGEGADFLALYPNLIQDLLGKNRRMEADFHRDLKSAAEYCGVRVSLEGTKLAFSDANPEQVHYAKAEAMNILTYYFPQNCAKLEIAEQSVDYVAGEEDRNLMRLQQMGASVSLDRDHGYVWVCAPQARNVDAVRKRIDDLQTSWRELFQVISVRHQGDFGKLFSRDGKSVRQIQQETGAKIEMDRNSMEVRITGPSKSAVDSAREQIRTKLGYDGRSGGGGGEKRGEAVRPESSGHGGNKRGAGAISAVEKLQKQAEQQATGGDWDAGPPQNQTLTNLRGRTGAGQQAEQW